MELSHDRRTPLYFQLHDLLQKKITSGAYSPGQFLPTESELIAEFGVSRVTVRKALELLEKEGLIERRRGYGTFVKMPAVEQPLTQVIYFDEDMSSRGFRSSSKMIRNELLPAGRQIAEALGVEEAEQMVCIERLRYADDVPMCIEASYLVRRFCPDVFGVNFSDRSLRWYLSENCKIIWKRAEQRIYAVKADKRLAEYLGVLRGDPLIYIERVSYTTEDLPLEFLRAYYRGDRYYLSTELQA